jgi:hypothetical protein
MVSGSACVRKNSRQFGNGGASSRWTIGMGSASSSSREGFTGSGLTVQRGSSHKRSSPSALRHSGEALIIEVFSQRKCAPALRRPALPSAISPSAVIELETASIRSLGIFFSLFSTPRLSLYLFPLCSFLCGAPRFRDKLACTYSFQWHDPSVKVKTSLYYCAPLCSLSDRI